MATPTFVWDSSVNKSILAFYNSVTGLPVFMDETTGLPTDVIDRDARILGRTKIHDGTNVLDVLIQDSAFGTVSKGLAVFGKYQVTPTTYTDGDAAPILLDANGRIVLPTGAATSAKQDLQPLAATTVTLYNVPMTLADTEYSQALPANTKILEFREQSTGFVTRFAFVTGKVATPTAPYRTLDVGEVKTLDGLNLAAATLYFACSTAGKVMEIECWS